MASSLIDVVNLSPRAVASRSKNQWLDAFHPAATVEGSSFSLISHTHILTSPPARTVEDPNGSPTHQGRDGLSTFHSSLIEPHTITFDIQKDFVDTASSRVTRLTNIHIAYFNNTMNIGQIQPAHLVYDIDQQSGKLTALRANWEIFQARMMGTNIFIQLVSFLSMCIGPFIPLLVKFGVQYSAVYTSTFFIGPLLSGGKQVNAQLMQSVVNNNIEAFFACFAPEVRNDRCVQMGGKQVTPKEAFDLLACGTSKFRLMRPATTSAYRTACWYERETASGTKHQGVYHFESSKSSLLDFDPKIKSMYLFEEN